MHKISWGNNRNISLTQNAVVIIVMTQKYILFLLAKCLLDSKMFRKDDVFPDIAKTPPQRFCAMMHHDDSLERSFQQSCQSLSNYLGDRFASLATVHKYCTRNFSLAEQCLLVEDSYCCGHPCDCGNQKTTQKCGQGEVPDKEDPWIKEGRK